ncbi:MAG: cupin domain-containing protein [Candidatus Latescibacterota bacterium]
MSSAHVVVRNWRDADPHVGHESAVIWSVLESHRPDDPPPHACLRHIRGITRHALQGGMHSDLHAHADVEQLYYVLAGDGEVLIGDRRYPLAPGTAAYLPPGLPHQAFASPDSEWLEHLVVSCRVSRTGSQPRVVNWRQVKPAAGAHAAAVIWTLLESVDSTPPDTDQPCLLGFHYLTRQALVRGHASDRHQHDDKEQTYYVLEGQGTLVAADRVYRLSEGDAVYLPPSVPHQVLNEEHPGWLAYLIIS